MTALGKPTAGDGTRPQPDASSAVGPGSQVGPGQPIPASTYLFWIGGALALAGVIYLFATAGFPPGTTTTYEFHSDGTTSTSTSPSVIEFLISFGLVVAGAVLMRASRAASSSGE